ncbi:unnamed protein product [Hydatigera taeniaeformis]|uniref:Uncharacterized protein n=1 Tax=Hydatigena taeniaeformis TaxID=6205 RepID=A0A0R3X5H9_HYDTA|nr:unnamed protein product [Hydatigera taeniaeformis]
MHLPNPRNRSVILTVDVNNLVIAAFCDSRSMNFSTSELAVRPHRQPALDAANYISNPQSMCELRHRNNLVQTKVSCGCHLVLSVLAGRHAIDNTQGFLLSRIRTAATVKPSPSESKTESKEQPATDSDIPMRSENALPNEIKREISS